MIIGGSGNNLGVILGAFIVMLLWGQAENLGPMLVQSLVAMMPEGPVKQQIIDSAVQMRLPLVGIALLVVLRYAPKGLIPEKLNVRGSR